VYFDVKIRVYFDIKLLYVEIGSILMNIESVVRDFIESVNAGEVGAIAGSLAEGVRLFVPGEHELAGEFTGREAFLQFLGATAAASGGTLRLATDEVFANGARAIWLGEVVAQSPDGELRNKVAHLVEFEGGLISLVRFYNHDQSHVDAFWSEAAA